MPVFGVEGETVNIKLLSLLKISSVFLKQLLKLDIFLNRKQPCNSQLEIRIYHRNSKSRINIELDEFLSKYNPI
jgi:hypothetical protein